METRGRRVRKRLDEDSVEEDEGIPAPAWSWVVAAGVFLIHLNVPSFIFSHGVLLVRLVDVDNSFLSAVILPPFFYTASWFFADPICRRTASGHNPRAKHLAIAGILVVTASIALNTLSQSVLLLIFSYGIIGGIGTSLVLTQAEEVLNCHFPSQRGLVQAVCHTSMALGQFGMPLLLNGLISIYGTEGGLLLHAGVVLQAAVGAALLVPPGSNMPKPYYHPRPRSYRLVGDVELAELSSNYSNHSGHSPLLPQRNWKNPATSGETGYLTTPLSSPVLNPRHKNINGVDILPEIPEENEDSDDSMSPGSFSPTLKARIIDWDEINIQTNDEDGQKIDSFQPIKTSSPKSPLSKWRNVSLQSEGNTERHDGKKLDVNGSATLPSDVTIDTWNSKDRSEELHRPHSPREHYADLKSSLPHRIRDRLHYYHSPFRRFRCKCCNWYCRFKLYVAILNAPKNINSFMLVPLWTALKEPKFLPSTFLHAVLRMSSIIFSTFTPYLVWRRIKPITLRETAFMVSVSAFTWLCWLLVSPCFSDMKPRRQKYVYLIGFLLSISGLYALCIFSSQSSIIISCAVLGVGHGAVKSSGRAFLENELGISKYMRIQGCMDGVAGCFVLILAAITGMFLHYRDDITQMVIILAAFQTITGIIWSLLLVKPLVMKLLNVRFNRPVNCWPPENDFMTPG